MSVTHRQARPVISKLDDAAQFRRIVGLTQAAQTRCIYDDISTAASIAL